MHERIRRFSLSGEMKDGANWQRVQDNVRNVIEEEMRSKGYVPNLDCGVHWSVDYEAEKDEHMFKLSMYGVFSGKKRSSAGAVYYNERIHDLG